MQSPVTVWDRYLTLIKLCFWKADFSKEKYYTVG